MPDLIRAFIAITLPGFVIDLVGRVQQSLKAEGLRMGWVAPANVHLTLKFLGDVEPAEIDPVAGVLSACAAQVMPLTFSASGLGVFPDLRRPRVLWMGIKGDIARLIAFQKDLDGRLADMSKGRFAPEQRPFKGHLTLGRIKTRLEDGILVKALQHAGRVESPPFTVGDVHLMQSRLTPAGAVYTPLRCAALG